MSPTSLGFWYALHRDDDDVRCARGCRRRVSVPLFVPLLRVHAPPNVPLLPAFPSSFVIDCLAALCTPRSSSAHDVLARFFLPLILFHRYPSSLDSRCSYTLPAIINVYCSPPIAHSPSLSPRAPRPPAVTVNTTSSYDRSFMIRVRFGYGPSYLFTVDLYAHAPSIDCRCALSTSACTQNARVRPSGMHEFDDINANCEASKL